MWTIFSKLSDIMFIMKRKGARGPNATASRSADKNTETLKK
jgi:hypothetical protein